MPRKISKQGKGHTHDWSDDELVDGPKSLSPEQLINGLDSGTWETLKDAGFEQGDFLPLYTVNVLSSDSVTFTTTTYDHNGSFISANVTWNDIYPSGVTEQVFGQVQLQSVGSGETVDLRIRNLIDGETVDEVTGLTSAEMVSFGPVNYTPTTENARISFYLQWKESPGTNSSTLYYPYITFGVKI